MTFDSLFNDVMTQVFGAEETRDATHAVLAAALLLAINGLSSFIAMFIKPPVLGVRFYLIKKVAYLGITWLAYNLRHAANSKQCGKTSLQIDIEDLPAAKAALASHGVKVVARRKPDT